MVRIYNKTHLIARPPIISIHMQAIEDKKCEIWEDISKDDRESHQNE